MDKVAILFNPSSGRGLSLKKKECIKENLKKNSLSFKWFDSESENHLMQLAREKAESFQVIMIVGGDTSFQIVASEIYKTPYNPALCMIPTGSANDIAKSLDSCSSKSILASLKEGKTHRMDICLLDIKGRSEKIYFVGSLSLGLGVTINQFISEYWKRHPVQAKLGKGFQVMAGFLGGRDSFKKNKIPLKIRLSGENFETEVAFSIIIFSNVPCYAGGLRVCPDTSPFDGKINCSIVSSTSLLQTTKLAYLVLRGKHVKRKEIQFFRSKDFTVKSHEPMSVQYDGKVISGIKEFKVSALSSAIKILG
ncbi:MAG: hypothetical protein J7L72_08610 [Candidatus Aminicenantes bacterium]|nr:hypothetical protein [Candidatus Aminicenantes bacterium]